MSEQVLPEQTPFDGVPYVGCAATIIVGSDCYPATVAWVSPRTVPHRIWGKDGGLVQERQMPARVAVAPCLYRGVEGHSNAFTEDQRYEYYADNSLEPSYQRYSWRPQRRAYVRAGEPWRNGTPLGLGFRRAYQDPCF